MEEPTQKDWRSDARLIDAINRADASAFETLYRRYRDFVLRLAYRFTADHDDALDVHQETFAYLLRKSPDMRLTAKMTTFLYPVVKNVSLTLLRDKRKQRETPLRDDHDLTAPPLDAASSRADLATVMRNLPEPQREIVLMRFLDGMTLAEIAQTLHIPLGTVKSRLHNAIAALRDDPRTRRYFER